MEVVVVVIVAAVLVLVLVVVMEIVNKSGRSNVYTRGQKHTYTILRKSYALKRTVCGASGSWVDTVRACMNSCVFVACSIIQ